MKISLIIPAYNEEKYIVETLENIAKYGRGLLEVILVDNNSSDKTKDVASVFANVKVVLEKKKGPTFARQTGYLTSSGDIIAYIDADTHITPDWVKKIEDTFKNPDIVCLSGPCGYYDIPKYQQILVSVYWFLGRIVYFFTKRMVLGGNFAIRRETLNKMRGFDTSIAFYGDDTNIAERASKLGKVKFDFSFLVNTSGRRFNNQGLFRTGMVYVLNFITQLWLKKTVTKKYKDIR